MKTGLDTKERLPPNTFSSLSRGLSGTTNIVSRKGSDPNSSPINPLDQAMERYRQNDWLTAIAIGQGERTRRPIVPSRRCRLPFRSCERERAT
ncbi:MAG: hypothetical protein AAES65_20165 [Candidatus Thiodiazotropha sp. (ex. Lucinoma kazani)]